MSRSRENNPIPLVIVPVFPREPLTEKLEEPLEAEDEGEEDDDDDSTELQGEIGAVLRALEGDAGDKDSDNESDKSRFVIDE